MCEFVVFFFNVGKILFISLIASSSILSLSQELLFFGCWVFSQEKTGATGSTLPTGTYTGENPWKSKRKVLCLSQTVPYLLAAGGKPFTKRSSRTEWEGDDGNRAGVSPILFHWLPLFTPTSSGLPAERETGPPPTGRLPCPQLWVISCEPRQFLSHCLLISERKCEN